MRKLIILALVLVFCSVPVLGTFLYSTSCNLNRDVSFEYRSSLYDLTILLYKPIAERSNLNFLYSPISIWITLAAIAEGADPNSQKKLFKLLSLPNDPCIREKYYQLAISRALPASDVNIKNTRVLLIDEGSSINPSWYNLVTNNGLLDVVTAPIRYNPVATANEIKRIMSARLPRLDLSGNSVLLDTMDYNGLWTTAFADAVVERAPFYNKTGQIIGAVDLMRVKKQARMGYLKNLNAKILELPVGFNGRYRMLFCVTLANNDLKPTVAAVNKDLVFEMFESLRPSYVQLDVAIPRIVISSEIDVRSILEDIGVSDLWTDPAVTRYISEPAAFPSSFVQRSTLVLNNDGLSLPPLEQEPAYGTRTGIEPILGTSFIADQPFLFGLFDAETSTTLLGAAYTTPTYT